MTMHKARLNNHADIAYLLGNLIPASKHLFRTVIYSIKIFSKLSKPSDSYRKIRLNGFERFNSAKITKFS